MTANCKNLYIASGSVTISPAYSLTAAEDITNNAGDGGLVIESDASNNGSLIVLGTSSGNITYNRYMTKDKWHLVSAPVGGQTIANFISTNTSNLAFQEPKYGLAPYDNSSPAWDHFTTSNTAGSFTAGKGYEIIRKTADGTFAFTGTIAVDNVSIGITFPSEKSPWNLVGNPYPSAICANTPAQADDNLVSINAAVLGADAYQAIYVWDANGVDNGHTLGTGQYTPVNHLYNGGTEYYIAPGQAFFVNSLNASGSFFSFTEAMQTHQTGDIFKQSKSANPSITLKASVGEQSRTTQIYYIEGMSKGLDPGYDAGVFDGFKSDLSISTRLLEEHPVKFAIQALPDSDYENMVVPIEVDLNIGSELIFSAESMNLPEDMKVYIEDCMTGTFNRLDEAGSSFKVSVAEGSSEGRFKLHTTKKLLDKDDLLQDGEWFTLIADYAGSSIRIVGDLDKDTYISIINMSGTILYQSVLGASSIIRVPHLNAGMYLIKLSSKTITESKKIYWK